MIRKRCNLIERNSYSKNILLAFDKGYDTCDMAFVNSTLRNTLLQTLNTGPDVIKLFVMLSSAENVLYHALLSNVKMPTTAFISRMNNKRW